MYSRGGACPTLPLAGRAFGRMLKQLIIGMKQSSHFNTESVGVFYYWGKVDEFVGACTYPITG